MTTQSVKLDLDWLDDEAPYDALRALRLMKSAFEAIKHGGTKVNGDYIEVHEVTFNSFIDELNRIISDASAVYAEHADLCKLMKHLNRAVRHYEVED